MKRRLVYCPKINAESVVLLFDKGNSGDSWSIRDYSRPGTMSVSYPKDLSLSLFELNEQTTQSFPAPAIPTSDLDFWHNLTVQRNHELVLGNECSTDSSETFQAQGKQSSDKAETYPLLNQDRFLALPKARKAQDTRRMFTSPVSEDWVTWNAFAILQQTVPDAWWQHLANLARHDNPSLVLPLGWQETPELSLWRCVFAPREYESASRARLLASGVPGWVERAKQPGPVEGDSEIDICLRNKSLTLFIEAKLGSDVSMGTTYDPERNQIARNIDCLLDEARETYPAFWMLVRDSGSTKGHTQLIETYRRNPDVLARLLPHRNPELVADVAARISVIHWRDLLQLVPEPVDNSALASVYRELKRRTQ